MRPVVLGADGRPLQRAVGFTQAFVAPDMAHVDLIASQRTCPDEDNPAFDREGSD